MDTYAMNQLDKLMQIRKILHKRLEVEWNRVSPLHLTLAQASLLKYLHSAKQRKTSEAAGFMCITSGALTMLCDKLVEKGLIERQRDEADRRVIYLNLSPKGRETAEAVDKLKGELFESIIQGLSAEDLDSLEHIYTCMSANLGITMEEEG